MTTPQQQMSPQGIDAVREFLQAGRHLTPTGGSITLRAFRGSFAGGDYSAKLILDTYYPDIAQAMRAAALAKVGGHRDWAHKDHPNV